MFLVVANSTATAHLVLQLWILCRCHKTKVVQVEIMMLIHLGVAVFAWKKRLIL